MILKEIFEEYARRGILKIPKKFRDLTENVAIVIEERPALGPHGLLLGLYEGVPRPARSHYTNVLPDKITLFKNHIEQYAAQTGQAVEKVVADTIWHEIAHHFGLDEREVRARERRRRR